MGVVRVKQGVRHQESGVREKGTGIGCPLSPNYWLLTTTHGVK